MNTSSQHRSSEPGPHAPTGLPVGATAAFYTGMVALAGLISYVRGESLAGATLAHWPEQLVVGLVTGVALAGIWWQLALRFEGAASVERRLREAVGSLSLGDVFLLAFLSGVGEELLFRGALQPWWGFWSTAVVFGLLHGGGARGLRWWTAGALVVAVLFGGLRQHYGSVLAPTMAHVAVNAIGLWRMGQRPKKTPT